MVDRITAYRTSGGKLTTDLDEAVAQELKHLASAGWDFELPIENAIQMVRKRDQIIRLLTDSYKRVVDKESRDED